MSRYPDEVRRVQTATIREFLGATGYSQEAAATLMGVDYVEFRKIASGHSYLSPYYIARMIATLLPPPPVTTDPQEIICDLQMRNMRMMSLLTGAALHQWERSRASAKSGFAWRDRPAPFQPRAR